MKKFWKLVVEVLPTWLAIAAASTILSLLVYTAVHQNYRQSANDPQIQLAEDLSQNLSTGLPTSNLNGVPKVDISKSLSAFFIIYDEKGKVLASNASLDGQASIVPIEALTYAKNHGENRLTWEPKKDARYAVVIIPFKGNQNGFVLVGRSLREVEIRERVLSLFVLAAWLGSLISSSAFLLGTKYLFNYTTYNSLHYKGKQRIGLFGRT